MADVDGAGDGATKTVEPAAPNTEVKAGDGATTTVTEVKDSPKEITSDGDAVSANGSAEKQTETTAAPVTTETTQSEAKAAPVTMETTQSDTKPAPDTTDTTQKTAETKLSDGTSSDEAAEISKNTSSDAEMADVSKNTSSASDDAADISVDAPSKTDTPMETVTNGDVTPGDVAVGDLSKVEAAICKQIEYYFGDINITRDRFLLDHIKENDGWISLETMVKFKRLAALSSDHAVITGALKKSNSQLMEVSEDNKSIRRLKSRPLPDNTLERKADIDSKTVYVKGFPSDAELDPLLTFMSGFGKIETCYMRRNQKKLFKGSCFVIFCGRDDAVKFMKLETVKYGETELTKMFKNAYFKGKGEEKKERFKEKEKKREGDKKKQEEDETEKIKDRMVAGALLRVSGFTEDIEMDEIKNYFNDFVNVQWVDFDKEKQEAIVRFTEEKGAQSALDKAKEKNEGKLVIDKNSDLSAEVMDGDSEIEHWKNVIAQQSKGRDRKRQGSKQKPNPFRRGSKRGKYAGGDDWDEPSKKKQK